MTEADATAYRKLWASVALIALTEHRLRIHAAAQHRTSVYLGSNRAALGGLDDEIAAARAYVSSRDFRWVCELAGVVPRIEKALTYLEGAIDRISMKSVMESAA